MRYTRRNGIGKHGRSSLQRQTGGALLTCTGTLQQCRSSCSDMNEITSPSAINQVFVAVNWHRAKLRLQHDRGPHLKVYQADLHARVAAERTSTTRIRKVAVLRASCFFLHGPRTHHSNVNRGFQRKIRSVFVSHSKKAEYQVDLTHRQEHGA